MLGGCNEAAFVASYSPISARVIGSSAMIALDSLSLAGMDLSHLDILLHQQ